MIEPLFLSAAIGAAIVAVLYIPGIRVNLAIADEGYLLFGTIRVLEGRLPIRDFRAYDPGRYYWCAPWLWLFGKRIIALRLALAFTMVLALALAARLIAAATGDWIMAGLGALILYIWMKPAYKIFEITSSLVATMLCWLVIMQPGAGTYFVCGLAVGLVLLFGHNLALYLAAAGGFVVVAALLSPSISILSWDMIYAAPGFLLGFAPGFLLAFFAQGYAAAFYERKIRTVLVRGATNQSLPRPWLWRKSPIQLRGVSPARRLFFRLVFTMLAPTYGLVLAAFALTPAALSPSAALAVGAAAAGLGHFHHVVSRANIIHLTQASHPFLLVLIAGADIFPPTPGRELALAALLGVSIWAIAPAFDGAWQFLTQREKFTRIEANGEYLWLKQGRAARFLRISQVVDKYSKVGDRVWFAPMGAAFYPLLARRSPVYDILCVYPASESAQTVMIKELKASKPRLAIIDDTPYDLRDELRFSRTHPKVWRHLEQNYRRCDALNLGKDTVVFMRKPPT